MSIKNTLITLTLLCLGFSLCARDFVINMGDNEVEWNLFNAYNTTEAQIFTGLYEGLVAYHPATNKPIPAAAESWTLSEDRKTYTFTLRDNLFYSNGDPVLAEHFRQSWLRSLDPEKGSRFASLLDVIEGAHAYNRGEIPAEEVGITALSDTVLQVSLKEPAPQFLSILCHYSFSLVHPLLLNLEDWATPIHLPSSGPYAMVSRSDQKVVLEKNPYYWDADSVEIDQIILAFGLSPEAAMNRFNDYSIDWMFSGMDTSLLEDSSRMVLAPSFATSYYFFSNKSSPWDNPNVRRALALLLPWDEIKTQFLIPGYSLVPPIPQYPGQEEKMTQNQEEAMRLLEEEGYPEGKGLPEIVIRIDYSLRGNPVPEKMQEIWSENLLTQVRLEAMPSSYYYDSLKMDDYTLGYISWVGDYADPMTFLQMWKSDSSFNDAGYQNSEFDRLLSEAALQETTERYQILSQAEALLLNTAEVMPVQHLPSLHLIDLRVVDGWFPNALDIHPLKNLSWKSGPVIPGLTQKPLESAKTLVRF